MPAVDVRAAQAAHRTPTDGSPRVGIMRELPPTYDVTAFGQVVAPTTAGNWYRGELVRGTQPAFQLAPNTPMYDPSMGPPAYWRP